MTAVYAIGAVLAFLLLCLGWAAISQLIDDIERLP